MRVLLRPNSDGELEHQTQQAHSRAAHPQAQNRGTPDSQRQDRRLRLPSDRGEAADLPPLEAAVRANAGQGGPAAHQARCVVTPGCSADKGV